MYVCLARPALILRNLQATLLHLVNVLCLVLERHQIHD